MKKKDAGIRMLDSENRGRKTEDNSDPNISSSLTPCFSLGILVKHTCDIFFRDSSTFIFSLLALWNPKSRCAKHNSTGLAQRKNVSKKERAP
ncbi:MAG: hypothetical protein KGY75_07730 [Candidatus Cloacimonetes bacterium]|nr:hypothetical protein [Candidatus Cloacimonadota bacterium]